jgi:hypothetical protein
MRTRLLATVVFCFGVMAGGAALAQVGPAGDHIGASPSDRTSSGRWDNPGYVYGPNSAEDDVSLESSRSMQSTTGQGQPANAGGCDLSTHLNTAGGGCVPLGPD